ncbi:MAG: hypothetical protein JRF07_03070 [Deltaproteobacteria bacterium]|jgi:hypothetical protein|nr:hypothetical protein [Deltaproteobacteria bacterium]
MKRFRFTLLAVCLVLLFLGGNDLLISWQNPSPVHVTIAELETAPPPREWVYITDGHQDLDRAISTSGTIELDALLIPLLKNPEQQRIHVLVETHRPELLDIFREYHFFADTLPAKKALREKHPNDFKGSRNVTGMLASGLVAKGNREKLLKLAQQTGMDLDNNIILVSENKTPNTWRGMFFFFIGILGLSKFFLKASHDNTVEKISRRSAS